MLMQCLLQFTPDIMRSLFMLFRVLVFPSSGLMTYKGDHIVFIWCLVSLQADQKLFNELKHTLSAVEMQHLTNVD